MLASAERGFRTAPRPIGPNLMSELVSAAPPAVLAARVSAGSLAHMGVPAPEPQTEIRRLPRLDEHTATVAAEEHDVWNALLETVDQAFSGPGASTYARIVGCADATASGPRPLVAGSTIPGFRVTAASAGDALVLEGRHRFSSTP